MSLLDVEIPQHIKRELDKKQEQELKNFVRTLKSQSQTFLVPITEDTFIDTIINIRSQFKSSKSNGSLTISFNSGGIVSAEYTESKRVKLK